MGDLNSDFLTQSEEVKTFDGLKDSMREHVSNSLKRSDSTKLYRHDRKLKFKSTASSESRRVMIVVSASLTTPSKNALRPS